MTHDLSSTIPDEPEQDPDAVVDEPSRDLHGLSDSPHSGYEEEMEADGPDVPAAGPVDEGDV